jgi:hypothetical protein
MDGHTGGDKCDKMSWCSRSWLSKVGHMCSARTAASSSSTSPRHGALRPRHARSHFPAHPELHVFLPALGSLLALARSIPGVPPPPRGHDALLREAILACGVPVWLDPSSRCRTSSSPTSAASSGSCSAPRHVPPVARRPSCALPCMILPREDAASRSIDDVRRDVTITKDERSPTPSRRRPTSTIR